MAVQRCFLPLPCSTLDLHHHHYASQRPAQPVHDRMPVILPRDLESSWLDLHIQDIVTLSDVLTPYASAAMEAYEISSLSQLAPQQWS